MNPSEPLKVDTLISFLIFDEQGTVTIQDGDNKLVIKKEAG